MIASEPSNPWVAGIEMLYSREFLTAARDRLAPGGVYAQWIHAYEMDDATLELVLRTYASVFDRVAVWYTLSWDLVLLGFDDANPGPQLDRIDERIHRSDLAAGLRRAGVGTIEELAAHELVPVGHATREALPGPLHTLLHPVLSHQAARAFFGAAMPACPTCPRAARTPPPPCSNSSRHASRSTRRREPVCCGTSVRRAPKNARCSWLAGSTTCPTRSKWRPSGRSCACTARPSI